MSLKFDENLPIYIQIMDYIKKKTVIGEIKEGDKLPSVRELSSDLKVNPNTVSRVYQELEREGLTYTQRGMGTFITEDKDILYSLKKTMARDIVSKFIYQIKELHFSKDEILALLKEEIDGDGE
ncbi:MULTISPECIES: GntR family transcriptional regulator [Clostridium]|uniref:GntR family transcriptional regulator n=1 Tax=Clostridium TaxID=1485 RepID=UPI0002E7762A|nr:MULTISPECIES: GntR family transcriptional regulator [Clostridium]